MASHNTSQVKSLNMSLSADLTDLQLSQPKDAIDLTIESFLHDHRCSRDSVNNGAVWINQGSVNLGKTQFNVEHDHRQDSSKAVVNTPDAQLIAGVYRPNVYLAARDQITGAEKY